MIEHAWLLLPVLFAKKSFAQDEFSKMVFEPTRDEITALLKEVEATPQERIGGKLQPRIDVIAQKRGILTFDQWGNILMRQPSKYNDLLAIYKKVQGIRWAEQERVFEAFPEEREKFNGKIKDMMQGLKDKLGVKTV